MGIVYPTVVVLGPKCGDVKALCTGARNGVPRCV